ncbi:MAG TPA: IclR family transcriptional regulator [Burkholderiales bacterium]|nr:IclR family transcriptional regulator [Burkholderiales bacterium]
MTRRARSPAGAGGIKSVAKVLDILEYLADAGRPVGASEVARAVGFHVSTTHRLLRTLAARGYVDQHAARRSFVLGPQLHALGNAYAAGGGLVQVARPELEALRDALGETIHLGVFRNGEVLEVASASGLQPVSVSLGAGRRDPAHCTALGKVLLAGLDPERLAAFLRRPLERRTRRSLTRKPELLKAIEATRSRGYGTDEEELAPDMCCVAVPVRDPAQRVVAALSIAMPKSRYRSDRVGTWVKALAAAADRIGGRLRADRV